MVGVALSLSLNGWFFLPEHAGYISFNLNLLLERNHAYQKFLFYSQGRYWWVKVLIAGAIFALLKSKIKWRSSFVLLGSLFICGSMAFSSINFYCFV